MPSRVGKLIDCQEEIMARAVSSEAQSKKVLKTDTTRGLMVDVSKTLRGNCRRDRLILVGSTGRMPKNESGTDLPL
jgi:hypothetical protein